MIINKSGLTIRLSVDTVRVAGRATQGVRLIKLKDGDSIASVAKVEKSDDITEENGNDKNDENFDDNINSEN